MSQDNKEIYKKLIDSIFESSKKDMGKSKERKIPKIDIDGMDMAEVCKEKGIMEIEELRLAYLDFQKEIKDLSIYPFLDEGLDKLASHAKKIVDLIEADPLVLSESDKNLRARILSEIYVRYVQDRD